MYGDSEVGALYGIIKVSAFFLRAGDRVRGSDEFKLWSTDVDKEGVLIKKKPTDSLHSGKYELQVPVIGFAFEYIDDCSGPGLREEVEGAGTDLFFEDCEEYLVNLAEQYREEAEKDIVRGCSFWVLWKVTYTKDYWGEYDSWWEPVGEVFMNDIIALVEKREKREAKSAK